jgi:hypothetical protein
MTELGFHFVWWRFGWGRARSEPIGGWRRLFWRLWWRTRPRELEAPPLVRPPDPAVYADPIYRVPKRNVMHWSPDSSGVPFCACLRDQRGDPPVDGADWTIEWAATTCPDCRKVGEPIVQRLRFNNR